jgi:hypothetical protein
MLSHNYVGWNAARIISLELDEGSDFVSLNHSWSKDSTHWYTLTMWPYVLRTEYLHLLTQTSLAILRILQCIVTVARFYLISPGVDPVPLLSVGTTQLSMCVNFSGNVVEKFMHELNCEHWIWDKINCLLVRPFVFFNRILPPTNK